MNLKKIRELIDNATPGPWEFIPADNHDDWMLCNSERPR